MQVIASKYVAQNRSLCCQKVLKVKRTQSHKYLLYLIFFLSRSDPLTAAKFEFEASLLENYKGRLQQNEIELDDLTIENLNHM